MTHHFINLNDLPGISCTSINIVSASRAADTAELSLRLDSIDGDSPWAFGDEVTIRDNGEAVFHGYVTTAPDIKVDSRGVTCDIRLENIVALLDATPYTERQSMSHVATNDARLVSATSAIRDIIECGKVLPGGDKATEEHFSLNYVSTIVCPSGNGAQSCWSLINSCLHWIPDAVTWYNPKTKTLNFSSCYGDRLMLDLSSGEARVGERVLFTFDGYDSAAFRARHDLCPPAVGLIWEGTSKRKIFPSGGTLNQPWAFQFQIPKKTGAPLNDEDIPSIEKRLAQRASGQNMLVLGRPVPSGWSTNGNMKNEAPGEKKTWKEFWSGFSAMSVLSKTNVSCVRFGVPVFEPTPVDEAYPQGPLADEEVEKPENYKEFTSAGGDIFVLTQGQFPASSKKRDNLSGLKFCKGRLKQYIWLTSDYIGDATKDEYLEFFSGTTKAKIEGKQKTLRYALLELDGIFINRRRKRYQTGTNILLDENDEDYERPEEDEEIPSYDVEDGATDEEYTNAANDYFNSTRKLYYDGSISLRGVRGYNPADLNDVLLNIIGARSEWEDMQSPIVQAEWNPQHKTLVLSTGSPEILTIDERVQRTLIARESSKNAGTSFANPPKIKADIDSPPGDDGEEAPSSEEEAFPMVSPSIAANVTAIKSGRPLNPFQLFQDGDRWYINEGSLPSPDGIIKFETTDVTAEMLEYDRFSVVAKFLEGEWQAVVLKFKNKENAN